MKKHVFTLLPLLIISLAGISQRNRVDDLENENFFRVGGKVGVNVNKAPGKSYKEGFNYNYQVGGFLQFNFSRRFGLQPEVNFTQASSLQTKDVEEIWDDIFRDGTQRTAKLNYLEVPVLVNMNLGESRHVKLQAGPSYNFYLKKPEAMDKNYLYKNGEISMIGGLWIQLPFINMGARYKMGLSNVKATYEEEHNTTTEKWKNQAIQVFVGVTF